MHAAFLAAIADRPDDDLPRLVYADYLEENGDPERAEFIRVQIELANLLPNDPRRESLAEREAELWVHKEAWVLPEFRGQSQVFRRGFVEQVNVAANWLIDRPRSLLAPGPLRVLRVFGASAHLPQLAEMSELARLETLDLSNTMFGGAADVRRFFTTAKLARLRELTLRNSNFWEDEEVRALASARVATQLKALDLSGNRLADPGLRAVAEVPAFGGVEVLTFRANELEHYSCATAAGAAALAESATLTRLKALDLSDHYIGDEGLRAVVNSPNAQHLERLAVEYNEIGETDDSGILAVTQSPRLANLRELRFGGNRLGRRGAEELAAWPHLERMHFVSLAESPLSDEVRTVLRRSAWANRFVFSS